MESKLPKPHFKSITVSEETYNRWLDYFNRHKKELRKEGINHLATMVESHIHKKIEDSEKLRKLALKINKVPEILENYT